MLLVIAYSRAARQALRNCCNAHPDAVLWRFGRAVCLAETELGAFLALRLRERHGGDVQVERTRPFNEFREVPERVRDAAVAYEARDHPSTPYVAFAAGTDHPTTDEMAGREL